MAVEDVDGQQTALETVQLLRCDAPVLLLVQARPVPEYEHLPVTNVELLRNWVVISKVPGHVQIGEELGNVGEEPVLRVGVLRAGPAVGEHDDERAVPRPRGSFLREGSMKGASLRTLLLQPGAPQETHGRVLSANLESSSKSLNVSSCCASCDGLKSRGVKHLVLAVVRH